MNALEELIESGRQAIQAEINEKLQREREIKLRKQAKAAALEDFLADFFGPDLWDEFKPFITERQFYETESVLDGNHADTSSLSVEFAFPPDADLDGFYLETDGKSIRCVNQRVNKYLDDLADFAKFMAKNRMQFELTFFGEPSKQEADHDSDS